MGRSIRSGFFWKKLPKGISELWWKEGGKNTNFFCKMAKAHSRRNFLAKIKINGTWILEENEIKDGVFQAF